MPNKVAKLFLKPHPFRIIFIVTFFTDGFRGILLKHRWTQEKVARRTPGRVESSGSFWVEQGSTLSDLRQPCSSIPLMQSASPSHLHPRGMHPEMFWPSVQVNSFCRSQAVRMQEHSRAHKKARVMCHSQPTMYVRKWSVNGSVALLLA